MRRRAPLLALLLLMLLIGGAALTLRLVGGALGSFGTEDVPDATVAEAEPGAGELGEAGGVRERDRVRVHPATGAAPTRPDAGDDSRDAAGGDEAESADAKDAETENATPAEGDAEARRHVRGQVVDAASGERVPNVRVLVVRSGSGWRGTRGDEDGHFEGVAPEATEHEPDAPVELRVAAKGYVTQTVPWSGGEPQIELVKRDHPALPGVVAGLATDPTGRVVSGRVLVSGYDEMGDHFGQWADADERGAFRLEGMSPGYWRLRAEAGGDWVEVIVPEGGETSAHLKSGPEPWPGALTEEAFRAEHEALRTSGRSTSDAELAGAEDEEAHWRRILAIQDLECRWRGVRPRFEVRITGLTSAAHAHVRAATTSGPNHSWRRTVVDGGVTFRLTAEDWRLVLEVPGEPDQEMRLRLPASEEPVALSWKPGG